MDVAILPEDFLICHILYKYCNTHNFYFVMFIIPSGQRRKEKKKNSERKERRQQEQMPAADETFYEIMRYEVSHG